MRWLTREVGLWLAVLLLAALPRFLTLDYALSNDEALVALTSLSALRGQSVTFTDPFFQLLQTLTFAVFGANDVTARVLAAAAGSVMCVAPVLLRDQIGRSRALIFGGLLALSPTLWFVSRQSSGASLAWLLAFVAYCTWRTQHPTAFAVSIGLLLACGVNAVTPLLMVLAAIAFSFVASREDSIRVTRLFTWRALLAGVAAFALASTGLLLRPSGLGDAFNGYASWAQSLTTPGPYSIGRLLVGLIINEPLIWIGGAVGLVSLIIARSVREELSWLAWIGAGLLMCIVTAGRGVSNLVPLVIGGAAFASIAYERLLSSWIRHATWARDGAIAATSFVLFIYAGLGLRQYAGQGQSTWLYPVLIAIMMTLAIIAASSVGLDLGAALRGTGAAFAASLFVYSLATGVQLTQVRPNNPAEPYVATAPNDELRALTKTLEMASLRSTGEPTTLQLQVIETAPPALRWALRDQTKIAYTPQVGTSGAAITPASVEPKPVGGFVGDGFDILYRTGLGSVGCTQQLVGGSLDCGSLARWLAFREADDTAKERWVLWLREDVAAKVNGLR